MKANKITRQELYDLVWKESLTSISKRLTIPFTHLRKICKEMSVPIPPNGHWSKLSFGKPVEIFKLSQDYQGRNEMNLYPDDEDISNQEMITFNRKSAVDLIKEDKSLTLTVPNKLINPVELVAKAEKQLSEYKYNAYNDHGMVRAEGNLSVRVSRHNIGRAIRFMDTLLKLIIARGHKIEAKYSNSIQIDDEHFEFKLMEKTTKVGSDPKWGTAIVESTGLLYFEIKGYMGRTWIDDKIKIEDQLVNILVKIESIIFYRKENHRINEEASLKQEDQARTEKEKLERIDRERTDFIDIYGQAKRWQIARLLREYIKAVEENASINNSLTNELQIWLKRAIEKVDWYDPLVNKEDKLMQNFDKDKVL